MHIAEQVLTNVTLCTFWTYVFAGLLVLSAGVPYDFGKALAHLMWGVLVGLTLTMVEKGLEKPQ